MAIYTSTTGTEKPYAVLDTVFAIDSHKAGFFSNADPNKAFDGVKKQLVEKCAKLGGHAVLCCQFEYRNAVDSGLFGAKQVIEIFAYGTAVRFEE